MDQQVVTYQLVSICFGVGVVCTAAMAWFFSIFQTKKQAHASETLLRVHIKKVESDVEKAESSLAKIATDVSYIRGRLEPPQK